MESEKEELMISPGYVHTLTLYNRIRAADTSDRKEHWIRTVLHNCFWKSQIKTGFRDTGVSSQNVYVVRVPEDARYLPYAGFVKQQTGRFTFSQGDLVVLGECKEEITGETGHTMTQVLNRHSPDAFQITAFTDNTSFPVSRHYRLGG